MLGLLNPTVVAFQVVVNYDTSDILCYLTTLTTRAVNGSSFATDAVQPTRLTCYAKPRLIYMFDRALLQAFALKSHPTL